MQEEDLHLKLAKCAFDQMEVEYLGLVVRNGEVLMDPTKLQGVTVEEQPTSFSPFSSADCTLLSHFSFNDFVAIAFPDLAGDLDIQL